MDVARRRWMRNTGRQGGCCTFVLHARDPGWVSRSGRALRLLTNYPTGVSTSDLKTSHSVLNLDLPRSA